VRAVFTGQLGIEKKKILDRFAQSIVDKLGERATASGGRIVDVYKLEASFCRSKTEERNWVETPDVESQLEWWQKGFSKLLSQIGERKPKNVFLSMHAVILKYNRYISPLDWNLLRAFAPDLFVTFIDDLIDIWWRIKHGVGRISESEEYRLHEILAWRSAEIMMTETLARNLMTGKSCPHYIVAVKHPMNTLERLILEPSLLRVYTAYPITDVKKMKREQQADSTGVDALIRAIDENRARFHNKYITFDPITIDEFELKGMLEQTGSRSEDGSMTFIRELNRWPVRSAACDFPLLSDVLEYPDVIENIPADQVEEVALDMSHQISWRDYALLDQVHCMAAYRPNFGGGSTGVNSEFLYSAMKPVSSYGFWPADDGEILRPFKDRGLLAQDYERFLEMVQEHQDEVLQDPESWAHGARFETT